MVRATDPTIHSTPRTNRALLLSMNRDRRSAGRPRRHARSGLRVVEAALRRFPNGETTMSSTANDKPKSKRPRKFAREPLDVPPGTNALPSRTANDVAASEQPEPKLKSKASLLLDLLARPEGSTLEQIVAATDWLPHTSRAALTGLKKKSHTVTSIKTGGVRTYRVVTAKSEPIFLQVGTEAKVDS